MFFGRMNKKILLGRLRGQAQAVLRIESWISVLSSQFVFLVLSFFVIASPLQAYKGAGVVPFAVNQEDGKVYLLLGLEVRKGGSAWIDFGGARESADSFNSRVTAAREGAEELACSLDADCITNLAQVKNSATYQKFLSEPQSFMLYDKTVSENDKYYYYFVKINFDQDLPKKFLQRSSSGSVPREFKEKSAVGWFPLSSVEKQLEVKRQKGPDSKDRVNLTPTFIAYRDGLAPAKSVSLYGILAKTFLSDRAQGVFVALHKMEKSGKSQDVLDEGRRKSLHRAASEKLPKIGGSGKPVQNIPAFAQPVPVTSTRTQGALESALYNLSVALDDLSLALSGERAKMRERTGSLGARVPREQSGIQEPAPSVVRGSGSALGGVLTTQPSYKRTLRDGRELGLVLVGDVGDLEGYGAIVNAANSNLAGTGGVSGAIFEAAGGALLTAQVDIEKRKMGRSSINPGEAIITPIPLGTKLAKQGNGYIIHAVGPDCRKTEELTNADKLLYSAYTRSMELAEQQGLQSIAFPFISAAIFACDNNMASSVAVGAIANYLKKNPTSSIKTVLFFFRAPKDLELYQPLLQQLV